jgi:hypothetical protein
MIVVEWNVTRLCTRNYAIRFWIYDKEERSYYWKQWELRSIHKLRDPKRLFLIYPECPFLSSHLNYTKDYREFEVTRAELEKGFPGIDL